MVFNTNISQILETLSYTSLFLWLLVYNFLFFVPLPPPEVILVSIGYIGSLGHINIFFAGILFLLTFWISGLVFYSLTLKRNKVAQKIILKFGGKKTFLRFKNQMKNNPFKIILILTFIPTIRSFGSIISASLKIKCTKFSLYSFLSNSIFCVSYISLGYLFHNTITKIIGEISILEHFILYPAMIIIILIIMMLIKKHFLTKKTLSKI